MPRVTSETLTTIFLLPLQQVISLLLDVRLAIVGMISDFHLTIVQGVCF